MTRSDTLQAISVLVRLDPMVSIAALGYLAVDAKTETLEELLVFIQELEMAPGRPDHLAAYRERWGRSPGESGPS